MIQDMSLAELTPRTQDTYIRAVAALQAHYGIRPDHLTEKQVYAYVLWMRDERGVAKGTLQTHFHGLKFFYFRCLGYDWALFTRKKVRLPRQKRLPSALPPEDCRRLIAAIDKPVYRLCASTMYTLGLRIAEAISFAVDAIDSKNMTVRLIGKRNKERILPLPESLLLAWRAFWKTHRHPLWLFPNRTGSNHLSRKSFYRAFRSARERARFGPQFTPHCLRHGFATQLLESGLDIRTVQILLGHASIRSTQIYTHLTEARRSELQERLDELFASVLPGGLSHDR
jgi:site-specific recombinase XerD